MYFILMPKLRQKHMQLLPQTLRDFAMFKNDEKSYVPRKKAGYEYTNDTVL